MSRSSRDRALCPLGLGTRSPRLDTADHHKTVALVLATHADCDGSIPERFTPSLRRLGREASLHHGTVGLHLGRLERDDWIDVVRPEVRGSRVINRYRLLARVVAQDDHSVVAEHDHSKPGVVVQADTSNPRTSSPKASPSTSAPSLRSVAGSPDGAPLSTTGKIKDQPCCTLRSRIDQNRGGWAQTDAEYDDERHYDQFMEFLGDDLDDETLRTVDGMVASGEKLIVIANTAHARMCGGRRVAT